jgi:hypothetical protein
MSYVVSHKKEITAEIKQQSGCCLESVRYIAALSGSNGKKANRCTNLNSTDNENTNIRVCKLVRIYEVSEGEGADTRGDITRAYHYLQGHKS